MYLQQLLNSQQTRKLNTLDQENSLNTDINSNLKRNYQIQQNYNQFGKPRSLNFGGNRTKTFSKRNGYELLK